MSFTNGLKLYNKEVLLNFFKCFKYIYCALTEPEKQYLISININIKPWNFPIVIPDQFMFEDLYLNKNQSMSISSDESDAKDENFQNKQENNENDMMKMKIISMKKDIENYLFS